MSDDPKVRAAFGHRLRAHVNYQDGRGSEAPSIVFADCDYEVGDGKCGLHEDGKSANEPAIVYARADALMDALASIEQQAAEIARLKAPFDAARAWKTARESAISDVAPGTFADLSRAETRLLRAISEAS